MKIKKLISFMVLTALFAMTIGPALATAELPAPGDVSTTLERGVGGGLSPIIKAKWEMNGPSWNGNSFIGMGTDDSTSPGAQFNPPGNWDDTMTYTVCAIATDPNGVDDIDGVYADIYYPTDRGFHELSDNPDIAELGCGAFIEENTLIQLTKEDGIELFCNKVRNTNNNLPIFSGSYDYDEICGPTGELEKEEAYVYCDDKTLIWEDPAGDYKVAVFAQDNAGNSSDNLINHFEYRPMTSYEVDFSSIDYGQVLLNVHKKVSGDLDMTTPLRPTVRNTGNTRLRMRVAQDDMDLGKTSGAWNVRYDGRLGNNEADWKNYYPFKYKGDPGDPVSGDYKTLEDILDLSETEELDFSILITKWPAPEDNFTGDMWLDASQAPFRTCVY